VKAIIGPDVYVNASVAAGSTPQRVVQRVIEEHKGETATTQWILDRVEAMLAAHPVFVKEAIPKQMEVIRDLVRLVEAEGEFGAAEWEQALVAAAKAAGVERVITDHPDLVDKEGTGVEFMSTEAWLIEASMPPPPPGS
jgi:hypothetical protein